MTYVAMTSTEMVDRISVAVDKLAVLTSLFGASDADLDSCRDGIALLTESIHDDIEDVIGELETSQ